MIKKIIVHGGRAHLDDVMACAIAMCKKGERKDGDTVTEDLVNVNRLIPIERGTPTQGDLDDPQVVVLDVGRRLEPEKSNFDHHQLDRNTELSAMRLLAKELRAPSGESMDTVFCDIFPWWETLSLLDQRGPFIASETRRMDWKEVSRFIGPLGQIFLDAFEDAPDPEARGILVASYLTRMIDRKVAAYDRVGRELVRYSVDGVDVLDFTKVSNPGGCELVSGIFAGRQANGVAVFLSRPREDGETWENTGLTLMRISDDPRIDFNRVREDHDAVFVHSGGFLATTKLRDDTVVRRLIANAIREDRHGAKSVCEDGTVVLLRREASGKYAVEDSINGVQTSFEFDDLHTVATKYGERCKLAVL